MSNSLAIAAVTATLSNLLTNGLAADPEIADALVTTRPPDKARNGDHSGNQLNLFLYHMEQDAAWHDAPMPNQGRDAKPPLALNLYYLLTAYGRGDEDVQGHQLLGRAIRTLLDTPILRRDDIRNSLADNDLHQQIERVRITRQPLTLDEMSKLWSTLQTQYRISVAYQVSVVLIESTLSTRSAQPILRRGSEDRGVATQAETIPPFPTIEDPENNEPVVILPKNQIDKRLKPDRALLGDKIQFKGHHLAGDTVVVRLSNPRLRVVSNPPSPTDHPDETEDMPVLANESTDTLVVAQLPGDPDKYPAGVYTVAVVITNTRTIDGQQYTDEHTSNEKALAVAPEIEPGTLKITKDIVKPNKRHDIELTLKCKPTIRPEQRVAVVLGDHEVGLPPADHPAATNQVTVAVLDVIPGIYLVRLRVDGVDSIPITVNKDKQLVFDDNQKVEVK